jgi:hypothetical protein
MKKTRLASSCGFGKISCRRSEIMQFVLHSAVCPCMATNVMILISIQERSRSLLFEPSIHITNHQLIVTNKVKVQQGLHERRHAQ